jgi:hypothetical protein
MKVVVRVLAVGVSILCCSDWGVAQPAAIQLAGPQGAGLLGAVPPEVFPKIEQLPRLRNKVSMMEHSERDKSSRS